MIIRNTSRPAGSSSASGAGAIHGDRSSTVKHRIVIADNEGSTPSGHARQSPAQKAAVEKSLAPYLLLECGHLITREAALLYSVFAPSVKDIFCERCDDFKLLRKVKGEMRYPHTPLF